MNKIVIYGTGAIAINAYYNFTEFSRYKVIAFVIEDNLITESSLLGIPVVSFSTVEKLYPPEFYDMFVAVGYVGMNKVRETKCSESLEKGYKLISFIHPNAILFSDVKYGVNCFIGACATIQQNVKIGQNVFIKENCNVGHDTIINDNCYIGGGAIISGNVTIKKNVLLGKGAVIKDGIIIEKKCIIGAGVTMLENSVANKVYIAPKPIKFPFSSEDVL